MPSRVTILPNEPIATINPDLYGHFAEHLGSCINCGVWVGEDSPIPNIGGLRSDLIEAFRRINPPILRWPGGCFADDYHWRDGVGPRKDRTKTVNIWWGESLEDNAFGTHEFINFCRLIGAQPYLAGNLGSGSVQEMRDWVEYCNFDKPSTLALKRAANGSPQPFNVKYWGVGNEAWGCGGNFCPEDYAVEYKRYATYLRDFGHTPLFLIACGPDRNKPEWTRAFLKKLGQPNPRWNARIHGLGAHYYCGTAGPSATDYTDHQWYELLERAANVEQLILDQRAAMDEFDPHRKIGLILDEWGTWHLPTPGHNPQHLWQQNTLRDALVAAITLNTFNRHADKLVMANLAQAVNVLQSLFLTHEDKLILTPTYHVFDAYQHHQGGTSLRVEVATELIPFAVDGTKHQIPALNASASIKNQTLTVTVTNADTRRPAQALFELPGQTLDNTEIQQTLLTADDIRAHNTFNNPEQVTPSHQLLSLQHEWRCDLPPASVAAFRLKL